MILGRRHSAAQPRMFPFAQLPAPPPPVLRQAAALSGDRIETAGRSSQTRWQWEGRPDGSPQRLWLPLEFLEARLGFRRQQDHLEWFGKRVALDSLPTRTLGDEVGLEVSDWLDSVGVKMRPQGQSLRLSLPRPQVKQLRRGKGSTATRLVLDLNGPVFVQRINNDLLLNLQTTTSQRRQIQQMGLAPRQGPDGLRLVGQATRVNSLSLNTPWRLVLDGVPTARRAGARRAAVRTPKLPLSHPQIAALLRSGLVVDQRSITVGVKPLQVFRAGGNLSALGLQLQPLAMRGSQQGLRFLPQLSQPAGALIAVNGGFFNRIRQLPLGALRRNGVWLSGPILNRGVIAWGSSGKLQFGRLRLDQVLEVSGGRRWGLGFLNSGYLQRGLSRYTRAWGAQYRALSGEEQALLIRNGRVEAEYSRAALQQGVSIPPSADLVVARGGAPLPAATGDSVKVVLRSNSALAGLPNVLGGGPLLMQGGQVVLNGRGEGFSPGFLGLSAPRTLVGQGGGGQWLLTMRGQTGIGPTLVEAALAARQLGLTDALNLDGGSSTTLVMAGRTVMSGHGSAPRVHNGLGLVRR